MDLGSLCRMHPRLPMDMAAVMIGRAALGLQNQKHSPGATLHMVVEDQHHMATLLWPLTAPEVGLQHDDNQITEDGAEAIALAMTHEVKGWRVFRRLQRNEHGDWLLERQAGTKFERIPVEVSGVAKGGITNRMREKLKQVGRNTEYAECCATVVGFEKPEASMQMAGRRVR